MHYLHNALSTRYIIHSIHCLPNTMSTQCVICYDTIENYSLFQLKLVVGLETGGVRTCSNDNKIIVLSEAYGAMTYVIFNRVVVFCFRSTCTHAACKKLSHICSCD